MQLTSLIGKKTYQKQGFLEDGRRVPLSAVNVLGNFVTQIKTKDKEGYNSLQLGIDIKKKANKSLVNHSKKAGLKHTPRFFKEIRVEEVGEIAPGTEINVSEIFQPGDMVDVTGISKGKGFAGGVKRHGFHGGPRTHGQSDRERAPGSIGQTTTPGRVYKGKRMAGRMGQDTVTVKNLEIIEVTNDGVLLIKGLVPGSVNSVLVIKKVGENKKFVPLYKPSDASHSAEASRDKKAMDGKEAVEEQLEEKSAGQPSVSDDVQPSEDNLTSDSASLSESRLPESNENQEQSLESTLDSSESVQTSSTSDTETKEEVSSDAKAMEDKE